jgi:hypothetical protein
MMPFLVQPTAKRGIREHISSSMDADFMESVV